MRWTRRTRQPVSAGCAAAIVLVLALSGCGDSSSQEARSVGAPAEQPRDHEPPTRTEEQEEPRGEATPEGEADAPPRQPPVEQESAGKPRAENESGRTRHREDRRGSSDRGRPPRRRSGPSKAVFVREADEICRAARRRAAEPDGKRGAEAIRRLAGIVGEAARMLRALQLPMVERGVAERYVETQERNASLLRDLAVAIEERDERRRRRLQEELSSNAERAVRLAREYGFRVCGQAA